MRQQVRRGAGGRAPASDGERPVEGEGEGEQLAVAAVAGGAGIAVAARGPRTATLLELLFLAGLGGVFLANALVAIVDPGAFEDLVAACPLGALIDDRWVGPLVAVNDAAIGLVVLAAHRAPRLRAPVLAWAGIWLLIVTLMKASTLA